MKEYEKTISELISDKEKSKSRFEAEREGLLGERDQSVTDLRNVEAAFADVHRKYERAKTVVEGKYLALPLRSFAKGMVTNFDSTFFIRPVVRPPSIGKPKLSSLRSLLMKP